MLQESVCKGKYESVDIGDIGDIGLIGLSKE